MKSLSITEYGSVWIPQFGKQLQMAEVASASVLDFPIGCDSLLVVNINLNMDSLNYVLLWSGIGMPLEKLTVTGDFNLKSECQNIQKY